MAYFIVFLMIVSACTGKLPDGGSLPGIDGGSVTNVNAATLGGARATSAATAKSVVQRDDAGNFSANIITGTLDGIAKVANFAMGRKGADLSTSFLRPGDDGNYFVVTASQVDGIADMPLGTHLTLQVKPATGETTLFKFGPTLRLSGNGDFRAYRNDILQFVAVEPGMWREVSRTTDSDTQIFLYLGASGAPVTAAEFEVPFIAGGDTQSEFNATDHRVHFKQSGYYQIEVTETHRLVSGNWTSPPAFCVAIAYVGIPGSSEGRLRFEAPSPATLGTDHCRSHLSFYVAVSVGNELSIYGGNNASAATVISGLTAFPSTPASTNCQSYVTVRRLH